METAQMTQGLIAMRAAIGGGAWLAPKITGTLFGLKPSANPQLPYVGRLFGVRDVALAFGVSSSTGSERAKWLRIGIACDLADAAAGVLSRRNGELSKFATVLVTGTALGAATLGVAVLQGNE